MKKILLHVQYFDKDRKWMAFVVSKPHSDQHCSSSWHSLSVCLCVWGSDTGQWPTGSCPDRTFSMSVNLRVFKLTKLFLYLQWWQCRENRQFNQHIECKVKLTNAISWQYVSILLGGQFIKIYAVSFADFSTIFVQFTLYELIFIKLCFVYVMFSCKIRLMRLVSNNWCINFYCKVSTKLLS